MLLGHYSWQDLGGCPTLLGQKARMLRLEPCREEIRREERRGEEMREGESGAEQRQIARMLLSRLEPCRGSHITSGHRYACISVCSGFGGADAE